MRIIESELGLNAACVLAVAGAHVCTVLVYHMRLEIQSRVEDDEFPGLTLFLWAGEMVAVEMLLQMIVVLKAEATLV